MPLERIGTESESQRTNKNICPRYEQMCSKSGKISNITHTHKQCDGTEITKTKAELAQTIKH